MRSAADPSHRQMLAAFRAILQGGLLAGLLDITAALLVYGSFGVDPVRLLQGIACGLLGPIAFSGGLATALLGLTCHFGIALSAAAVYWGMSRTFPVLSRHTTVSGVLFGVAVYFFMNQVVLPLSRATQYPFSFKMMVIGVLIHILCVGLPISLTARRVTKSSAALRGS